MDCCSEKAAARNAGCFEGPVGDDWYNCACKRLPASVGVLSRLKAMFTRKPKRYLRVGDLAPEGPITGAMIEVDPVTNRIKSIFQP